MSQLLLKTCKNLITIQKRPLFHWINLQFNLLDEDRLNRLGPDRVCAEWILRNGGKIKFANSDEFQADYNKLPKEEIRVKLQEIDATGSSIMKNGFEHLKNCKYLNKIILHECNYMENEALEELQHVKQSLQFLQVSRCGNVVESGLLQLAKLQNLQTLVIFGLPYVTDRVKVLTTLQNDMKHCKITYEQ